MIPKDEKILNSLLHNEEKRTSLDSETQMQNPLIRRTSSYNEIFSSFEFSQDIGGLFQNISVDESLFSRVFNGSCRSFADMYMQYFITLDEKLSIWKGNSFYDIKTVVENVRGIIKNYDASIDRVYNKRLGRITKLLN